jgi:hypothetical protein
MKHTLRRHAWLLIVLAAVILLGGLDQTTKDALKVQHVLRTIERKPQVATNEELTAEVTEKEVNAYIAYRLAREKAPIVNRLTVNLLGNNQIQGKISFDADQLNLGGLLGEDLDFDFKGIVQTRNHAARLNLIALSLGGYAVKPQVLDFVLSSAGMVTDTEVGRVEDWYALPKGIKRIVVRKARAVIYY